MALGLYLLAFLTVFTLIECKKSGEEIADLLYKHSEECKDPRDGGIWAPLASGQSCGLPGHDCKYPSEWCSAKSTAKSVPQFSCVKLPDECRKALEADESITSTSAVPDTTQANSTAVEVATTTTTGSERDDSDEETVPNRTTESSSETSEFTGEATEAPTEAPTDSSEEVEVQTRAPKPRARVKIDGIRKTHESGGQSAVVEAPASPPASACVDAHPLCCVWANEYQPGGSECNRNAAWMRVTCQKSCGTCGCKVDNYQICKVKVNTEKCPYLRGSGGGVLQVPVANGGGNGNAFSFPTAGGARGRLSVPVGSGAPGVVPRGGPVSLQVGSNVNSVPVGTNQVFFGRGPIVVRTG